ncbi:aldehyde dehydrogenase (NADP(+)) [Mucilaginibacter ginsenosidivorax]|uniref:Aldehyde dehydrogenase (NADP(+)) n=1 Tax=Mucilaginibacter ginsenosidivorax TaxID=862126 RepID=A0A5B8W180_9SPHI|nr:aldehyde dehydrogenase (NADP(+)) [Mucilaginibacter ginsenosidivorax]QEC77594.1 aldehyde dehydrogenase (NADP(+)) [Mucilaginibacter ginsenosidivorax]
MANNFKEASVDEITQVMQQAQTAFEAYQQTSIEQKSVFLEAIAAEIEALGDGLLQKASEETNLPIPRLTGERARTTGQLRMFATMLREGSWVEASIDTANPDRAPLPKPDVRKMLTPLGPVVVFGASNFPFAYSTAGGDTASALAAGCPVVVKAHPAHAETSEMVYSAIKKAIVSSNMPGHIFQHVHGTSFESGKALVQADETAAVGFTGSTVGGLALLQYSSQRKKPIPVFSEMGSINPVVFLPDTLNKNAADLAAQYAGSITLGMGQFCTNPGLMLAIEGDGLYSFLDSLGKGIEAIKPAKMLHAGIHTAYQKKSHEALAQDGVKVIQKSAVEAQDIEALPTVALVSGKTFLANPLLHEEVFGPYSLMVNCKDEQELLKVLKSVSGQLTTTVMGTDEDFAAHKALLQLLPSIAGRVLFNGVPTGVEVCHSMVHGGPFPATTDSRFTAVGTNAVKRWVRPVCYQNCPDGLLPLALQNANPLGIWRLVDNEWKK